MIKKNDIFNQYLKIFNDSNLKIAFKVLNEKIWKSQLDKLEFIPFDYEASFINYLTEYNNYSYSESIDLSVLIYHEKSIISFMPGYFLADNNKNKKFILYEPLFINSEKKTFIKKIYKKIDHSIKIFCNKQHINEFEVHIPNLDTNNISYISNEFYKKSIKNTKYIEMFINTELKLLKIDNIIRSSNVQEIHSAKKKYKTKILSPNNPMNDSKWEEFKKLHFLSAGRKTRSDKSWKIQLQNIESKNAVLIYIEDNNNNIISGSYFDFSRDVANYSVSASNRKYFKDSLSKLIIYDSIIFFNNENIKWLRLGNRGINVNLSDKEFNILEFKESFVTDFFTSSILLMHNN